MARSTRPSQRRNGPARPGKRGSFTGLVFFIAIGVAIYWFMDGSQNQQVPRELEDLPPPPLNASASWAATQDDPALLSEVGYEASPITSNYYVVFDGSGSMLDRDCSGDMTKMQAAQDALVRFAGAVPTDANLGLFVFDHGGTEERVPLGNENRAAFVAAVEAAGAGGGTPLGTALEQAAAHLQEQAMRQLGYGDYNLVVVTDGYAEDPDKMVRQVRNILTTTPVTIHTIGFCIDENHALNLPGLVYYRSAMDPDELLLGLESVLAESPDFQITDFDS